MGCGDANIASETGRFLRMKTVLDLLANSIYIAVLLFSILCAGYFGLSTGDCGLTYALKSFEFVWGFMLVVGFMYLGPFGILFAVALVVSNFPSERWTHPLRSLSNFFRLMLAWAVTGIGITFLGFLITKITGSHSHCTVGIGF
jgi:hypothetical protein